MQLTKSLQAGGTLIIMHRKWIPELEDAICELQQNMEIECDNYFEEIMPKAIKVQSALY